MIKDPKRIEIWGGLECTINRIGDCYRDQLELAGHYSRENDIELLAGCGVKKLRYPVLWEKHQPTADTRIDWTWAGKNLERIRSLGVTPIVGLLHHGSGPKYASIETEKFATGLAAFAEMVAKRFPWVDYYTPINEPLTTARFCGLYGHWYPHQKENADFLRLLINECKATVLAMQAIRKINPGARLIQTEDLSKTYSSPLLQYQADFENKRRWLGFDLLMGKVNEDHQLWSHLMWAGIRPEDLHFFYENHCIPDILGFNFYPTSERFLDEDIDKYPKESQGGNHIHRYADVEAVRVDLGEDHGAQFLLQEAWERFKLPIAVTEVHLGCTREEQLRWLGEMYTLAAKLKKQGTDIRAITAWAMFGSFGWNKLLAGEDMHYEPGVFDLRAPKPRPTALATMLERMSSEQVPLHPAIETPGWWKRESRIIYFQDSIRKIVPTAKTSQPILILGKTGTLGKAFAKLCELRGLEYKLMGRDEFHLSNKDQMEKVIAQERPWAIVNAAGFVRVDEAEVFSSDCYETNSFGPALLASLSKKYAFKLVCFSSDLVFDGSKKKGYIETDLTAPLNIYGRSKALAEKLVLEKDSSALFIRTSAFFGPWDEHNFLSQVLSNLKNRQPFTAMSDVLVSPTYLPDLVHASLDLMIDDAHGIWHLSNQGETSWAAFAFQVAEQSGLNTDLIIPVPYAAVNLRARRPLYSVLSSEKAYLLPTLEDAVQRYLAEQEVHLLSSAKVVGA